MSIENHSWDEASEVSKAVRSAVIEDNVEDITWRNRCTSQSGDCNLSAGIEHLFVSHFSATVHRGMNGSLCERPLWEFAYSPHQRTEGENELGFDLSLGHYVGSNCIRTQHKLKQHWCDLPWEDSYSLSKKTRQSQVVSLVRAYEYDNSVLPFFVWHVCLCLHDYRRMGRTSQIPSFEDFRRTVTIDLRPLAGKDLGEDPELAVWFDGSLHSAICLGTKLNVLSLDGFIDSVAKEHLSIDQ